MTVAPKRIVRVARATNGGGNYFATDKRASKQFFSSGCTTLDLALGGGWREKRIGNIIGDSATGKTLLAIEACANFSLKYPKGKIRYRESESAFDNAYGKAIGMPVERIDFGDGQLETVEDLFEDLEKVIKGARSDELVIVDSLDGLSDRAELARDIDEGTYGAAKAKLMGQLFRRLTQSMANKRITLLIVSQVRDNIGAFGHAQKWTRSGGKALQFYCSQVLVLANTGRIVQTFLGQKRTTGIKVMARMNKNKVGLPYRDAQFQIRFGYGIDDAQACVDFLNDTKRLKEVDIQPDEVKGFLNYLLQQPKDKMDTELNILRDCVTKTWYEIEMKTLTPRAKYGA